MVVGVASGGLYTSSCTSDSSIVFRPYHLDRARDRDRDGAPYGRVRDAGEIDRSIIELLIRGVDGEE